MQALQRLLFDGFDAHRHDVGGTRRFQQRTGVGGIGLVALHVGTNVGGGQKLDLDAQPVDPARPVVRGATGFHDDQRDLAILKPALELGAGETMRFDDLPGRIGHGQLLGLKPPDGGHFLLAQVSWNLMLQDELLVGVHVLPGLPEGIAVRPTGANVSHSERYVRAFLLPAVPALDEPASLVLPRGWFQAGRIVEAFTDRPARLRLDRLMANGPDFERIAFTRL